MLARVCKEGILRPNAYLLGSTHLMNALSVRVLSALAALCVVWGSAQAAEAVSVVHLGQEVPTADQVKEGLYPDWACEELRQNGYKCMGFKPAVNFSLPASRFALGSHALPRALQDQLEVFAKVLKTRKPASAEIRIVGHADASGSDEVNNALSRQRAQSVKTFLVEHGVSPQLLVVHGEGARQPADPVNPTGSINRRVEIGRLSLQ